MEEVQWFRLRFFVVVFCKYSCIPKSIMQLKTANSLWFPTHLSELAKDNRFLVEQSDGLRLSSINENLVNISHGTKTSIRVKFYQWMHCQCCLLKLRDRLQLFLINGNLVESMVRDIM